MSRAEDDEIARASDAAVAAQLAAAPKPKPPPPAPPPPSLRDVSGQALNWIERAVRDWAKGPFPVLAEGRDLVRELTNAILRDANKPNTAAQRAAPKRKPKRKPRPARKTNQKG